VHYVVVTGNDSEEIIALKTFLDEKFKIKDLGKLYYFRGMEVLSVSNGLIMTQRKFAMELLKELHCEKLPATSYPLGSLSKTSSHEEPFTDVTIYRKLVGKLNYLTNSKPYIAFFRPILESIPSSPHSITHGSNHTYSEVH